MDFVPIDTACSILSNGFDVTISDEYIDGLIDDKKINLYVRVWDGLARPSEPLVRSGLPAKKEILEHINRLDDLMEAPPKIFKCIRKRSISESVDYYTKNDLPVSYKSEELEYFLLDYEKAHWVLSQNELLTYIEDTIELNSQKKNDIQPITIEHDWIFLKKGCWDLGEVLVQAWRISWESGNTKTPTWKVLNGIVRGNIGHEYFEGYSVKKYKATFSIHDQHKQKKTIIQSLNGILKKIQ